MCYCLAFMKAFNTVPHGPLSLKLRNYLPALAMAYRPSCCKLETVTCWVESNVVCDGISMDVPVSSGVPMRRSVLVPALCYLEILQRGGTTVKVNINQAEGNSYRWWGIFILHDFRGLQFWCSFSSDLPCMQAFLHRLVLNLHHAQQSVKTV